MPHYNEHRKGIGRWWKMLVWERDNDRTAVWIVSALSQPVVNLVLMYIYAKVICDKFVSVYEKSSIQRLSLLMTEFFKLQRDPEMDIVLCRCSREVILRHIYRVALTRFAWHTDSTAAWADPSTVGPEYQEFSNVWESFDDNKRTTNSLLGKLYDRKTVADIDDSGRFQCVCDTRANHVALTGGKQNNVE